MDLDTIIYIITVIVIFIVSLLGQNKKKKNIPVQTDSDDMVYSLNDFEKILQRKEQFRQEFETVAEENEEPLSELDDEVVSACHTSIEEDIEEKIEERKKEKTEKHIEDNEEKEDGFDLNSAIIYSSILERKKFRH